MHRNDYRIIIFRFLQMLCFRIAAPSLIVKGKFKSQLILFLSVSFHNVNAKDDRCTENKLTNLSIVFQKYKVNATTIQKFYQLY